MLLDPRNDAANHGIKSEPIKPFMQDVKKHILVSSLVQETPRTQDGHSISQTIEPYKTRERR